MPIELRDYQIAAIKKLRNGSILCGGVGSGKSRTSLAYYYTLQGLSLDHPSKSLHKSIQDLYIITTARKRDTLEWEKELTPFLLSSNEEENKYSNKVTIDSWNNLHKYSDVKGSFFIFDEQRVVGSGAWVKAFLKIAKTNKWILLSATPGDTWSDYIPVFIANGFYKNKTDFARRHIVYSRFAKYPKVDHYVDTGILNRYRRAVLVNMDYEKHTVSHYNDIYVEYDRDLYRTVMRTRVDPETGEPIVNASDLCFILRRVSNSDPSRLEAVVRLVHSAERAIIFYNFNYELALLKSIDFGPEYVTAEWNGHKHEPVPEGIKWAYFVQYTAGAEGWNCTRTNTIIFFSQNYSYKVMVQSAGRIDRLNTPYENLYYYRLKTHSNIDLAIAAALKAKKKFNEDKFVNSW